jgi:hypothetical protein
VNPVTVGITDYPDVAYAHQGWLTEDQAYLLVNDELDELGGEKDPETGKGPNTRTIVFDVTDLENPTLHFEHFHDTYSIDHNLYVHDGLVYQSNYTSGLRVLDVSFVGDEDDPRLEPHAFFDTYPWSGEPTFDGTWSNYPYFESGTIAVSGIDEGLFLLRLSDDEAGEPAVEVACADCPVRIRAGESGSARLEVTNTGGVDDTYQVTLAGLPQGWTATLDPAEVAVGRGELATVDLRVDVPRRARAGSYPVTVTVTSSADDAVSASEEVAVVVRKGKPS